MRQNVAPGREPWGKRVEKDLLAREAGGRRFSNRRHPRRSFCRPSGARIVSDRGSPGLRPGLLSSARVAGSLNRFT
jgi:hypothetical protein